MSDDNQVKFWAQEAKDAWAAEDIPRCSDALDNLAFKLGVLNTKTMPVDEAMFQILLAYIVRQETKNGN